MAVLLAELAEALVAQLLDLEELALVAWLLYLAHLALKAQLPVLAHLAVEAQLADLVLVAAVPLQRLLSRQSFSAAMARNTP